MLQHRAGSQKRRFSSPLLPLAACSCLKMTSTPVSQAIPGQKEGISIPDQKEGVSISNRKEGRRPRSRSSPAPFMLPTPPLSNTSSPIHFSASSPIHFSASSSAFDTPYTGEAYDVQASEIRRHRRSKSSQQSFLTAKTTKTQSSSEHLPFGGDHSPFAEHASDLGGEERLGTLTRHQSFATTSRVPSSRWSTSWYHSIVYKVDHFWQKIVRETSQIVTSLTAYPFFESSFNKCDKG